MRIGQQLLPQRSVAVLLLPRLGVTDEKALVAGQSVDHRRLAVPGGIFLVRRIGRLDAAEIAKILA